MKDEGQAQSWLQFSIVAMFFFFITAATFTSLGVVLRFMIEDLSWGLSQAGIGFSLLASMVGLAGAVPAWTLRRFGVKTTFGLGGLTLFLGFILLASTESLVTYFMGATLLGLGYAMSSNVPGVHVINGWLAEKQSFAIGLYLTLGGLGGVAGPLVVTSVIAVTGSWRTYWLIMAGAITVLTLFAVALIKVKEDETQKSVQQRQQSVNKNSSVFKTDIHWRFKEAIRTPQFFAIVAALTMSRFCGISMNSWAFVHMSNLGVASAMAAGALSAHAVINALARALGGTLANHIDPKWLLASGLVGELVGMIALSVADDPITIILFALGEGFGFGMCLFAVTMIVVNYFGTDENPEIMGTVTMVTTIAMLGPVLGGIIGDVFGGIGILFQIYAVILLFIIAAVVLMKPPQHHESQQKEMID